MKSLTRLAMAGAAALLSLSASPAIAGEGLFSRLYTTDTTPKGTFEIEQVVREREGRAFGHYDATDFRTELEYGVTDDLQVAGYLNLNRMHATGAPDDDDDLGKTGFTRHNFTVQSVSAEFIYRVISPYKNKNGWGLAFYLEPAYDFHDLHNGLKYAPRTMELEARAIVQKNFLDDRLIIAYNLVLEAETIRFAGNPDRNSELDWNNELGASYRFKPNWYAGLEFRNHNEYGNFKKHEHSIFWAGPVLHYGGEKFWATLGYLRQFAGSPGYDDDGDFIGGGLFTRSHEKNEITLKVAFPFK